MPEMKSFAVFVIQKPKEGKPTFFHVIEVDYTEDDPAIERKIADYINNDSGIEFVKPIPAGATNYGIYAADDARSAASQAKRDGLSYMSVGEIMQKKADEANAEKFGTTRSAAFQYEEEAFGVFGDIFDGFGRRQP